MTMRDAPLLVDVLSETIALSTYGNTRNVVITAMEVEGTFDRDAGVKAARKAHRNFPQFVSCLKEIRSWGRHYLVREPRPDFFLPVTFLELPEANRSRCTLNDVMALLRPRLDREWDPFREVAVEFFAVEMSLDHHILVCACHHVAADAATASEFGKEFLMRYHEIITGGKPAWANEGHAISTSRKRPVKFHKNGWKEAIVSSHRAVLQMFENPVLPAGSGRPGDLSQYYAKRVLSEEQSASLVVSTSQKGATLVDAVTAYSNLAIDNWNSDRNIGPGLVTTAMTVNTRGRFSGFETPNNSSVIFFKSDPHERQDARRFIRILARSRMRYFREHKDLTSLHNVRRMAQLLRFFPFRLRRRIVHFMLNRHRFSIAVTLLGAVWPRIQHGKMTADSSITSSGDLMVKEVHGIGYKLHSGTRLLLIAYAYRNRLNFILESAGDLFTPDETEAFLDLIVDHMLESENVRVGK